MMMFEPAVRAAPWPTLPNDAQFRFAMMAARAWLARERELRSKGHDDHADRARVYAEHELAIAIGKA